MKRKYILAAATLAVLCVGTAAYNMKQNTELPSDAPNSSGAPSSIASSEPESGSTSVTDNRDIAKAENRTIMTIKPLLISCEFLDLYLCFIY